MIFKFLVSGRKIGKNSFDGYKKLQTIMVTFSGEIIDEFAFKDQSLNSHEIP